MEKTNFTHLLEDLYNVYNPKGADHIPELVELYNRQEFDSVKKIFIKYNHRRQPFYDPNVGTDEHVHQLIKDYAASTRSFQDYKLITVEDRRLQEMSEKDKETNKRNQDLKKEITENVDDKVKNIQKFFDEKIIEFEKRVRTIAELITKETQDVGIKIILMSTGEELLLQNKDKLVGLGIGARLIMKDKDEKTYGLEIVDIMYDSISYDKPIIELTVEKL